MWEGFCWLEVVPSPKVHEKDGVPVQLEGVAVALKDTARGAVPEAGEADAAQVRAKNSMDDTTHPERAIAVFGDTHGHLRLMFQLCRLWQRAAKAAGAPVIGYGAFVNTAIEFVIVMLVIFLLVKLMNRLRREKPADTKGCPYCMTTVPLAATRCPACTSDLGPA